MIKALIDTNIIIDIACERQPFFKDSATVLEMIDRQKLQVYLSASIVTDVFYLLRKELGKEETIKFLKDLLQIMEVLSVDKTIVLKALYSESNDFEDQIQTQVALENELDMIITRNIKDYKPKRFLRIITPHDFIKEMS